jgi:pimeloyl-ACP methyl ester carboxylesterase
MTHTDEIPATRVVSPDGTEIACFTSGVGPPLLLVHGTTADHTRWSPLLPYLEPHVTVHAMDRRGRGFSGDGPEYDLTREYEDVAAVVDAIAATVGSPVDVLGHSFGGVCAYGAALLTSNIGRLVLYEGWPDPTSGGLVLPVGVEERMYALIAAGRREAALEILVREVMRLPAADFEVYRALPAWQARIAAVHTVPRELVTPVFDPDQARQITVPVLMLVGEHSPADIQAGPETVAAALPDSRSTVLKGQQHVAMDLIPEAFAEIVLTFLRH